MSAQTKCEPSLSTDTTLSLSVISMFSLYWNVTALEAWNLFRVSCGLSAAIAFHMIFLKNYLNIPMMHTCKVNYIAYWAWSVICVSCTKTQLGRVPVGTIPIGTKPTNPIGTNPIGMVNPNWAAERSDKRPNWDDIC